jgi:hypothetical protein
MGPLDVQRRPAETSRQLLAIDDSTGGQVLGHEWDVDDICSICGAERFSGLLGDNTDTPCGGER